MDKISINLSAGSQKKIGVDFTNQIRVQETKEHRVLEGLDYESSGHTGFASSADIERLEEKIDEAGGNYTLNPATKEQLGGIKVGNNLEVTQEGVLSVATTTNAQEGNDTPISSDGVYKIIGNIDIILGSI